MKIKKSQLEQLIKVATLDILRELQSRAEEAGVETETANPPSPPIGPPMMEGKKITPKKLAPKKPAPAPKKTPKTK